MKILVFLQNKRKAITFLPKIRSNSRDWILDWDERIQYGRGMVGAYALEVGSEEHLDAALNALYAAGYAPSVRFIQEPAKEPAPVAPVEATPPPAAPAANPLENAMKAPVATRKKKNV